MSFTRLAVFLALSNALLGVSAGPLAAKRQDVTASSSSSAPSVALAVSTMSDGKPTTFEVLAPQPTSEPASSSGEASTTATPTGGEASTSSEPSRTGLKPPPSTAFPLCHKTDDTQPFCLPNNESTLYIGNTYYATWNPDYFPLNSTVTVKAQFINDSLQEVWSSPATDNSWGFVAFTVGNEWTQSYDRFNLTLYALVFEADDPTKKATPWTGPTFEVTKEPPRHYAPPEPTKAPNKEGLYIGIPVSLGFVLIVVVGLWIGMRHRRTIGIGNIMGRRQGYGAGKSRRQRLGLGKEGAIRLENREPTHSRGDSLGSLVSEDEIRPAPPGNHFRDEIARQKTGH